MTRYQLRLGGTARLLFRAAPVGHAEAHIYATNTALAGIPDQTLELVRRRQVGEVFVEMITVTNHREDPLEPVMNLVGFGDGNALPDPQAVSDRRE
jgi:hypothetical protein